MADKKQKEDFAHRLVQFSVDVLHLAGRHQKDRVLEPVFRQVVRSAGSVGANVTEASGSVTKVGYAHYFHIALQSANETRYWFRVLEQYGLKDSRLLPLHDEVTEFIKVITASLKTLKGKK